MEDITVVPPAAANVTASMINDQFSWFSFFILPEKFPVDIATLPSLPVTTLTGDAGSVGVPWVIVNPLPTEVRLSALIA